MSGRDPQRSIDVLYKKTLLTLLWGLSGVAALVLTGRVAQALTGGIHSALLAGPVVAVLIFTTAAIYLKWRQPSQGTSDSVVALAMALMFLGLAVVSIWVKIPTRLIIFAPLIVISGLFQRNRRLLLLTLLISVGALAFAWSQSPFASDSRRLAVSAFVVSIGLALLSNALVIAMVGRIQRLLTRLMYAKAEIELLEGLLPICSYCKKARDEQGYWEQVESYFRSRVQVTFSHGICPDCVTSHWPEVEAARSVQG